MRLLVKRLEIKAKAGIQITNGVGLRELVNDLKHPILAQQDGFLVLEQLRPQGRIKLMQMLMVKGILQG